MLNTSRYAGDRDLELLGQVLCRASIGIGGLNHTNIDGIHTSRLDQVHNEHGSKASNFITVQQVENTSYGINTLIVGYKIQ
jgi:hypothetical protein